MLKRSGILLLILAAAVIALAPTAVFAALGAHSIATEAEGPCAACHNVAQTAATRGWGRSTAGADTTGWYTQSISVLCWTCHTSGNPVAAHDVTTTALNPVNHSYPISAAPPSPLSPAVRDNTGIVGSNLPYTAGANLQCTSCHNVHNDQYRPFNMKSTVRTLCDTCHPRRNTTAVRAANIGVGADNVSVHPVNVALTSSTGATGIIAAGSINAALRVATPAAPNYALGGHLTAGATGNLSCETCHAVHGTNTLQGVNDLLAIDQQAATAAAPSSALCEGCHLGGAGGGAVGAAGTTDHPIDNVIGRAFYPTGVALPSVWTQAAPRFDRGASVFTTATTAPAPGGPRCSSCHDAHGGLGTKSLLRSPIPAAAGGQWCWSCHTVSQVVPRLHHSNNSTLATSQIGCNGCHGNNATNQTQWSAHNGFGAFAVGPDTAGAAPTAGTGTFNTVAANAATYEFLCELCHNPTNPTVANTGAPAPLTAGTTFTGLPSRHGVSTGTQTHLSSKFSTVGAPAEAVYIQDADRTFNSYLRAGTGGTQNWGVVAANAGSYTGQNVYSKYANYGTGTPQNPQTLVSGAYMVCESCHNLLTNAGAATDNTDVTAGYDVNLLLFPYADDGQGSAFTVSSGHTSGTGVGDGLCRGCHSSAVIVAANLAAPAAGDNTYVHYPAAHTVVSANFSYGTLTPYGRTTGTLMTAWDNASCPNTSTADMSTASSPAGATTAPGLFTYPAANALNCDSCHRPHNSDANGIGTAAFTAANAATVDGYILEDGTIATNNRAKTEACAQCHNDQIQCNY